MIICCIGDSLTEGDYGMKGISGIANVHTENYPYFLAQRSGAEVRNYGKCGWKSSDMLAFYREGGIALADADIVLLMLGTNGGQKAEGDSAENEAYRCLVEAIRRDAPAAKLYLITPPHATEDPAYSNCGYMPQIKEAVGFVRKAAKEWSLPLIDLAADPHFTAETEYIYQPNDGLHFGREGYKMLASIIGDRIL